MKENEYCSHWMKNPEAVKEVFRDMMQEHNETISQYQKILEAVQQYAEDRRELSVYLSSISDYIKTELFELQNRNS